jgi:hypothetical protein
MSEPSPLLVLEGVFHDSGDGVAVYPEEGESVKVDEALESFRGREVSLSLHHYPPDPPRKDVPGGGSCMWGGYCPCGHTENPAWLYNLSRKGVLERLPSGIWVVSEEAIPLTHYMLGHRGRLVVFHEATVSADKGVGDLLSEAESLLGILEGLRGALKYE